VVHPKCSLKLSQDFKHGDEIPFFLSFHRIRPLASRTKCVISVLKLNSTPNDENSCAIRSLKWSIVAVDFMIYQWCLAS